MSAQNVLIYNFESVIDSKVDLLKGFPDFVQTPTGFNSQSINTHTARYFCYTTTKNFTSGGVERYVVSFNNNGSRLVRLSACGGQILAGGGGISASGGLYPLFIYKSSTLTGASFSSINANSVIQADTSASAFSGGTLVYAYPITTQAVNTSGTVTYIAGFLEYIPKELYSVIIQPTETLTITAVSDPATAASFRIMAFFEEVIN